MEIGNSKSVRLIGSTQKIYRSLDGSMCESVVREQILKVCDSVWVPVGGSVVRSVKNSIVSSL